MSLCLMLLDRELFAAELKIMFLPLRDTCGRHNDDESHKDILIPDLYVVTNFCVA